MIAISISVLIPVYNRRALIAGALESALSQEIDGLEIVVVDNHSDDGTWELLQNYRDRGVRLVRNSENLGLFGNFNRCAEFAEREFTLFLCSDDRLKPGFLQKAVAAMTRYPQVSLLSSRGQNVALDGKRGAVVADRLPSGTYDGVSVPAAWFWTSYFLGTNFLNYPSGVVLKTAALKKCLPFDSALGSPADIDMFFRILQHGDLLVMDSIGCLITRHDGQEQNVYRKNADLLRQEFILLERYRPMLEVAGAYDTLRRQIATLVFSTLVRTVPLDWHRSGLLYREFHERPMRMLVAVGKRVAMRVGIFMRPAFHTPFIVKREGAKLGSAPRMSDYEK